MIRVSLPLVSYCIIAFFSNNVLVNAYAATKSPIYIPPTTPDTDTKYQPSTKRGRDTTIILRKTTESDLTEISQLLAYESTKSTNTNKWFANIQKLKAQSSFQTQILHRLQATEAATSAILSLEECSLLDTADERDTCRLLWSEDTFREKLERAVRTASSYENADTLWDNHNFNLQPSDPMIMNHVMMTAVDVDYYVGEENCEDGAIVGFCEVAMLPIPGSSSGGGEESSRGYAPCIANLVVSPNHRRRGIASRMIRNVERFVRLYWAETLVSCDDLDEDDLRSEGILGLYVDEDNKAATSLYLRKNFRITGHSTKEDGRLFLEKKMISDDGS